MLRTLDLERIPLASLALTSDGTVLRANDLALRYFKANPADLVGNNIFDWIESSDKSLFLSLLRADAPGSLKVTACFRHEKRASALFFIRGNPSGEAIVTISPGVAHSAVPHGSNGSEVGFDMVRAYQQILDNIPDIVLIKQAQSKIFWGNRAFRELYGMSNEQLRDIIDAPFAEPTLTENYIRDDATVFETGQPLEIPREVATRYDGERRVLHTIKSPIFDENGVVILTVGVSRDITDLEESAERKPRNVNFRHTRRKAG